MSFFSRKDKSKKFEEMSFEQNDQTTTIKQTDNMETKNTESMPPKIAMPIQSPAPRLKSFDIVVIDEDIDDNGKTTRQEHPEYGIKATSAKELIKLYADCGQKIRIIRENQLDQPPTATKVNEDVDKILMARIANTNPQLAAQLQEQNIQQSHQAYLPRPPIQPPLPPQPPKFFEIGGIKCKLENGKVYQEQWVRVDSDKFRLIADATNKILPLTGKHIETLKWVMIDDEAPKSEETSNG